MSAPSAADLVDQWTPLALLLARDWARRYPWLSDELQSDAAYALWQVATKHVHDARSIGGLVRVAVRHALSNRLRHERAKNPLAFEPTPSPDLVDPFEVPISREPEPGTSIEVAEEYARVAELLKQLSPASRDLIRRHFFEDEPIPKIAAQMGRFRQSIASRIRKDLAKIRDMMESR